MRLLLSRLCCLILILARTNAVGVGKAWQVSPYPKTDYWNHPSWPRLDSSAFEVRSISGVGRLVPFSELQNNPSNSNSGKSGSSDLNSLPKSDDYPQNSKKLSDSEYEHYQEPYSKDLLYSETDQDDLDDLRPAEKVFKAGIVMRVKPRNEDEPIMGEVRRVSPRLRREAENETKMEKITSTKNTREARQSTPESWSSQPFSVEFRHRTNLDQMIQEDTEDPPSSLKTHQAPRADFITSHYRRSYPENRESRDMPVTRNYDDYDHPWYRNTIRERDYEVPSYRRNYNYYYPDRYRSERDYYMRSPNEPAYYYDRYRDDDFDLYGRSRPTPKPKRIIYYATLPEIVRKPVDLRNYPRPYDGFTRTPASRDGTYKRIPGNVDPSRYKYRQAYDGYDSYSKRSSYYDRPYGYGDEESRRKATSSVKENLRANDGYEQNNERKFGNQILVRDEGNLPWPVQIGTEVSVKDDERIPGRKIFGENNGYERFHSAQLQKAPDATGSSELQSDT